MRQCVFISHPNVVISKDVPVPQWPLSEKGRERMHTGLQQPWINEISAIYCSTEQKAIDSADILATHLTLPFTQINALGENDRSATGFLPPNEFETVADTFFNSPQQSVRGWETAINAQHRITQAVTDIVQHDQTSGTIAIVSHGAVGTLLYCQLAGEMISRKWDQPPNSGGNFYRFDLEANAGSDRKVHGWWQAIDEE